MKKILENKRILIFALCTMILMLLVFLCSYSYSNTTNRDLANNLVRLHVIANSNDPIDQKIKLKIRDNILDYMRDKSVGVTSAAYAKKIIEANLDDIEKITNTTLAANGFEYTSKAMLGTYPFPTKAYGNVSLPAGEYQALRVVLGSGGGANWWCVMFPPLCFVDVSNGIVPEASKEALQKNLTPDEYELITNNTDSKIKFKFKIVELFEESKIKLASIQKNR
jgi:stage II sporulation protein R